MRYESLQEFLKDAERLASTEVKTLGNWSQGQIYEHLARSMNGSVDGVGFMLPAPVRWVMSLLFKNRFINKAIPAGFKSSEKFVAEDTISLDSALQSLRTAVERLEQEPNRVPHPAFGQISREEWDKFNLRHAEMHMGFLEEVPS